MGLTDVQKIAILEEAALFRTPEEIAEIYKKLGEVKYTARALGFACRYRGLDAVKALVECGAELSADFGSEAERLELCDKELLKLGNSALDIDYSSALMALAPSLFDAGFYNLIATANMSSLPFDERVKILDYFCENAEKIDFDIERFVTRVLAYGYEFADYFRDRISDRLANMIESDDFAKWDNFYNAVDGLMNKDLIPCLTEVLAKTGGKKFYYSGRLCLEVMENRFKIPGMYKFFFENFEPSERNKLVEAEDIIMCETTEIFDLAEQCGWFDDLEFTNKLIEFSAEMKNTEFTAWLLDCKNRKFDINSEREKFDKKLSLDDEN